MDRQQVRSLRQLGLVMAVAWGLSVIISQWLQSRQADDLRAVVKPGELVMLSSTTCSVCAHARQWFAKQNIPYRECVIETEPQCAAQFKAMGAVGTPTFVVRGRTMTGFDPAALRGLFP